VSAFEGSLGICSSAVRDSGTGTIISFVSVTVSVSVTTIGVVDAQLVKKIIG